jgi:hypothetical protein
MDRRMSASYRDALRAALLYLLLSVVWLLFSGYLLNSFFDDSAELMRWQLINGYAWVVVSAVLIFIARAKLFRCLGIGARLRERSEDRERCVRPPPCSIALAKGYWSPITKD